jgi:hypothetical protein
MKVKKSVVERIIREELVAHIVGILEADEKTKVADADKEKKDKEPPKTPEPKKPAPEKPESPPAKEPAAPDAAPADPTAGEKPIEKDPADASLDEPPDDVQDAGKKLRDQLTGKTVQSITREPKSKILPGAQEIVITWDQVQDPLRILVTKTGDVKFFYRGLHNEI